MLKQKKTKKTATTHKKELPAPPSPKKRGAPTSPSHHDHLQRDPSCKCSLVSHTSPRLLQEASDTPSACVSSPSPYLTDPARRLPPHPTPPPSSVPSHPFSLRCLSRAFGAALWEACAVQYTRDSNCKPSRLQEHRFRLGNRVVRSEVGGWGLCGGVVPCE